MYAVQMAATLSGQVMTAAFAMLGIQGAFLAIEIKSVGGGIGFWLTYAASVLCFLTSVMVGGWGITRLYKDGFEANWNLLTGECLFNLQAGLCLLGLILFATAIGVCASQSRGESRSSGEVKLLATSLRNQSAIEQRLISKLVSEDSKAELQKRLDRISSEVSDLRKELSSIRGTPNARGLPPQPGPAQPH